MAGHSQFKNIMHRKGRQDAAKSKLFGKLAREITVAARTGQADPAMNPRLRLAIQAARAENMPKDNIDRAIKKALGADTEAYEQLRYEGFGPNGVAVIVEALTNNRNRTGSAVRAALTKHGGNLGASGAVAHMFARVGEITYDVAAGSADAMLDAAIEAGAEDVLSDESGHTISCAFEATGSLSAALEERFGEARSVKVIWRPQVTAPLDAEGAQGIMRLIAALDDDDDVQAVFTNFEVDDATMAELTGA